eukprot:TRINITY_DN6169_c0_g2_i3.p1 TRINITY_DN6169_c0_g2~~TRINITY_DN6169_c0_g2_i3.p1  ORF type:complete len:204 (+),score=12.50 TRINITY_DN6169_c0_g2_i3:40-651(+)
MSRRYDYYSKDDDLKIIKTRLNSLDPITKKEIVNPWKNKYCGHVYEKETILAWIKSTRSRGKEVKCPYAGCTQRNLFIHHLVKTRVASMEKPGIRVRNFDQDKDNFNVAKDDLYTTHNANSSECVIEKEVKGRRPERVVPQRQSFQAGQHQPERYYQPPPTTSHSQQNPVSQHPYNDPNFQAALIKIDQSFARIIELLNLRKY